MAATLSACFKTQLIGQEISVDASCSSKATSYIWDFGDGRQGIGKQAQHHYRNAGSYTVRLQIQQAKLQAQQTQSFHIQAKPQAPIENKHHSNPYRHADVYINPDYAKEIDLSIKQSQDPILKKKMRYLQGIATAIWLDRIAAIAGGRDNAGRQSLEQHLIQALAQQQDKPMVVPIVLYNLPNRDCAALSSNGTLDARHDGLKHYRHDFIDPIVQLLSQERFASLRFVFLIEPDSLPNMITNLWHQECRFVYDHQVYTQGVQYALSKLSQAPNHYLYLDIGHSGWLGWDENLNRSIAFIKQLVAKVDSKQGLGIVDGFVSNISGSTPTEEPFLSDPEQNIGGQVIKSAAFYEWNPIFDEKDYSEKLYRGFTQAGFKSSIHILIDTSRNGWGGSQRPTAVSKASNVHVYVDESRLDRRFHRGNWCNPKGQGIGALPQSEPYGKDHPIAAFIWVKPPGESDGSSDATQSTADDEGKRFDPMCDPHYRVSHGPNPSGKPTGALANAPAAGHWFHQQFIMLIQHAYPSIPTATDKKP